MLILALESSTSSAKAMLYCSEKGIIETKTRTYPLKDSDINGVQNPEAVFSQMIELGRIVAEGLPVDMISLSGIWHSLLLCDKKMNPVTDTLSWEYLGAEPVTQKLRTLSGYTDSYYHKTGCMVHAMYPAFKLMFLKQQGYKLKDYNICSQGSYNFYQMTGKFIETESMVSGSGLMNIHNKNYDSDILKDIGIDELQLGSIVNYRQTSPLNSKTASMMGINAGIPVIPTNPDGGLNQVGAGALKKGVMTFSVGTSAAIRLSSAKPVLPEHPGSWCYMSPVSWLAGAATSGACNCVDWIKQLQYPEGISYEQLESINYDPDTLPYFLPFLYGERCPGWQAERYAGFLDIKPLNSPGDFYESVLEGVIFNIFQCYKILCITTGEPEVIKLSGGILNSPRWTQMCSDIFQREMRCSGSGQSSILGAAVLALHNGGVLNSPDEFKSDDEIIFSPDMSKKEMYETRFERYLNLYQITSCS